MAEDKRIFDHIPENLREDLINEVREILKEREGDPQKEKLSAATKQYVENRKNGTDQANSGITGKKL